MNKALAAIVFAVIAAPSWAQMTPEGLWRNIDDKTGEAKAEIRIQGNGAGVLTGVLEKRLAKDAKPDDLCKECSDDRKDKLLLGLEIIRSARKAEGKRALSTLLARHLPARLVDHLAPGLGLSATIGAQSDAQLATLAPEKAIFATNSSTSTSNNNYLAR